MLNLRNIIAAFLVMTGLAGYCQNDSTRYIFGLPVNENDTINELPQNDVGRKTIVEVVLPGKLPGALRKVLEREEQYRGWQDSLVYFNRNTRLFIVPVKHDGSISIYGLDEHGNPVSFSEVSKDRE